MIEIPVGLFREDVSKGVYEDEDLNDYERQQDLAAGYEYEDVNGNEIPGLYDNQYRIENWDQEDLVMYVGGDKELYR